MIGRHLRHGMFVKVAVNVHFVQVRKERKTKLMSQG